MANIYDYSECDEVAANMPLTRQLTYTQALAVVREQMPDESHTIISNVAWSLAQRSLAIAPTWKEVSAERYDEMLNILPPLAWSEKGFLVSEPFSQTVDGQTTYAAFVHHAGRYYEAEGSITLAAWRAFDPRSIEESK